ncbi:nucleotide pyrophosphohydrolase [Jeotgalibacillus sp. S-D1]|uniref:nucleotide pyrophosphohydrolase n=1 Tax=Jeotgalibacillus sp. S-D1 TaxID=2552189 RepID=UPI00105A76B9|nr:nucleotide pyrophosphohydrolase [Jeotgalibacillus sp. S-D1]TDL34922.1 nucleotide pyrophosphohydrolase [Jeotgalibacillus sp. S-D1]
MKKLQEEIIEFRNKRGWDEVHQEKDLALSIVLESSELLELFQWKSSEEAVKQNKQEMKDEMADVLIYLIQLASKLEIDLEEAAKNKMKKNAIKYPEPASLR